MTIPKMYTVDEVAAYTHAPRSSVMYWIKMKKIQASKVGRRWLIAEPWLQEFIDKSDPIGYYDRDTQMRLYEWCGLTHPIFGREEPSPEEAFRLGQKMGEQLRDNQREDVKRPPRFKVK